MTKYEQPSFTVGPGHSEKYRDNWEATFGKKKDKQCQFSPDCQRDVNPVEVGQTWCNFHLVTEGGAAAPDKDES